MQTYMLDTYSTKYDYWDYVSLLSCLFWEGGNEKMSYMLKSRKYSYLHREFDGLFQIFNVSFCEERDLKAVLLLNNINLAL